MAKEILDLNIEIPSDGSDTHESVLDTIARGAEAAIATETATGPEADTDGAPRPRRKYTRRSRKVKELTPEEAQQQAMAAELDKFFTADGIGAVFVNGINAWYLSIGADALRPEEAQPLAGVFAYWVRYRMPSGASSYQPEMLLVAMVAMTSLPRMKPIVAATVPWWQRVLARLRRRKDV